MDSQTRKHLETLRSEDRELQNEAFTYLLKETEKLVEWAFDVWVSC